MIRTILRIQYLRLRNNPTELLLVFVMPMIFFSIFAGIFSNGIATGADKKVRVGWISNQPTAAVSELLDFLESDASLQCSPLNSDSGNEAISETKMSTWITDAQRSGKFDVIVKLPSEFTKPENAESLQMNLVTDGQNPMAIAMVTSIVRGYFAQKQASVVALKIATMQSNRAAQETAGATDSAMLKDRLAASQKPSTGKRIGTANDVTGSDRWNQGSDWIQTDPNGVHSINNRPMVPYRWVIPPKKNEPARIEDAVVSKDQPVAVSNEAVKIVVENPQAASQENPRIAMYAAGIAVLFLLFSATGNAAALLEEAESGTLDRILVSKASLFQIVGGKWLGILLLGCLQISVMFFWAEIVFKIQLLKHLPGFCVMTFSTAAATASFAMLLATICKSRAQLNAVSVVMILSMSAVGGSMIPRFAMSDRMKDIGRWTFNAWALDGYQKVFWFQSPLTSLFNEVAVLLGSSLVLGLLTLLLSGRWKKGSF
jgi:ABC-2 type transport system permease protein